MLASYHNHTTWSDGRNSVADMIEKAVELHLAELGISDHYVLSPTDRQPNWSMTHDQLPQYVEQILNLRESAANAGVNLRLGLEVDWFPGHAAHIQSALEPYPFDFLLGSVHAIEGFTIDGSPAAWQTLDPEQINAINRTYWVNMRSLAESGLFDIVAHIDLPKKYGYVPTRPPEAEIDAALDAIAESGAVVELNTAGWHKPCHDAYPTLEILKGCVQRNIPTTLSADAHKPEHLLRDFDKGTERLQAAGYMTVARFADRARTFDPIDSSFSAARKRADSNVS